MRRKLQRKMLLSTLAVGMAVVTACSSGGGGAEPSKPADGQQKADSKGSKEITIFTRTGPESGTYLRKQAEEFTAKTGIKVNITEQGVSNYFTNLINQLVGGTDSFDIAATNSAYVGPIAAAGAIEPLDAYISKADAAYDVKDLAFKYDFGGKVYAMPFDVSVHLLYYRSDLIKNVPQTWDEYVDEAKKWTKKYNPQSPTQYGTSWTALAGSEQPKAFYSMMWSYGGEIVKDGKVGVASEGSIKAATIWKNVMKDGIAPPDTPNWGFPNVLDALKTGTIAMSAPMWSAAYSEITKSDSPYKDKVKVAVVPGVKQADGKILRTPFTHSWSLVMNKNAKNKEDGWKFIEFVTSKEGQMREAKLGGVPARLSVLGDASLQPREYYEVLQDSLKQARFEPLVDYYLKQHDIMNRSLSSIMTGTMEPAAALKAAQDELQPIVDSAKK